MEFSLTTAIILIVSFFIAIIEFWIIVTSKTQYIKMAPEEVLEAQQKAKEKKDEYEKKYSDLENLYKFKERKLNQEFNKKNIHLLERSYKLDELREKYKKNAQEEARIEVKQLKAEIKSLKRHIKYLTQFYPIIEDEADTDDIEIEYESEYLTKEEYLELSDTERNELAYERYKKRKKSKWEIGRDFEMYIGYMARTSGYKVEYSGIENKLKDLGRDLIVSNENEEFIVQCKYWSKNKVIHEKHLCQIYGTTIMYNIQNNKNAIPAFISHCALSETAKDFAEKLNIYVLENIQLKDFPAIKCNLKDKIYHLPFDQQYDTFKDKNCYYAWTIEEAESKGCRRAYKWHGEK